jgi:hypothetical protein
MLTVADIFKNVTDDEGHTHGEDGKFVSQGGSSSSSGADTSAPKKNTHTAEQLKYLTARPDYKVGAAKWRRDLSGLPTRIDIKATGNVSEQQRTMGRAWALITGRVDRETGTMTFYHQGITNGIGPLLAKLVKETRKAVPEVTNFKFENKSTLPVPVQEFIDELLPDGKPNEIFGKGSVALKATDSDVADSEIFKSIPQEHREAVVRAVRRELQMPYMPKKLALLTDSPVPGVSGGETARALAWALPTAKGHVVRIMSSKEKWRRRLGSPTKQQSMDTFAVDECVPPEKRVEAVITHEMGHVLEHAIKQAMVNEAAKGDTKLHDAYTKLRTAYTTPWKKTPGSDETYDDAVFLTRRPSRYAMTNFAEFFAESYAAHRLGLAVPTAAKEFFDTVGIDALEKLMSKLYLAMGLEPATSYDCHILDDDEDGPKRKMAHDALSRFGVKKSNAAVDIRKYKKWWEEAKHPRDAFGKFTSGFSQGAFAPSDGDNDSPVDPPENPKEGWQNEPPYMGASAQHGISADHPALDAALGEPNSGYLPSTHAFTKPTNPEVAEQGAKQLSQHLADGDIEAAKNLVHANPEILYAFRKQNHGSNKNAKKAAAFLNATTDATWVQHGAFVNKPKNVPKQNPLAVAAAQSAAVGEQSQSTKLHPLSEGGLLPYDPKNAAPKGSLAENIAIADANDIHLALQDGDFKGAREIVEQNPQALYAFAAMNHGSNLKAKSAAAFLHLVTGKTFAQHGSKINMPKGPVPASSWVYPGSVKPSTAPPAPTVPAPTEPQAAPTIIPPPGIAPPLSEAAQAKQPTSAWAPVEATPLSGIPKQGGTNPGGFFELADGTKGYAKFYSNPEQMQTEYIANQIYRKVGLNAPDSQLLTIDGKKCIFSPLIENGTQIQGGATSASTAKLSSHQQILDGFAADAILANHDVVGLDHDNVMFTPDGQAHRMDNGGSLKYRAQGKLKSPFTDDAVPELETMRDPKYGAGKIFQGLDDETVAKQVLHVAQAVKPTQLAQIIESAGLTGKAFDEHEATINGRISAALKWAENKLPSEGQKQTADNLAQNIRQETASEGPLSDITPGSETDKLTSGINMALANTAKYHLHSVTPESPPIELLIAMAHNDDHAFADILTSNPGYLAFAMQKKWTTPGAAQKVADIMSHLTGEDYWVSVKGGDAQVQAPLKNVIATPPGKIHPSVLDEVPYSDHDPFGAEQAVQAWKTSGPGDSQVVNVGPKQLASLVEAQWPQGKENQAKAAAGLLEHKTGHAYHVNEDLLGGFFTLSPGGLDDSNLQNEAWPGEYKGHHDPASPWGTTSPSGYALAPNASAKTVQQFIDNAHAIGNHNSAEWMKLHAAANDKLNGGPNGSVGSEGEPMSYADIPHTEEHSALANSMLTQLEKDSNYPDEASEKAELYAKYASKNHAILSALLDSKTSPQVAGLFAYALQNEGVNAKAVHDPLASPHASSSIEINGVLPVHQGFLPNYKPTEYDYRSQSASGIPSDMMSPPPDVKPSSGSSQFSQWFKQPEPGEASGPPIPDVKPTHDVGPMFTQQPEGYYLGYSTPKMLNTIAKLPSKGSYSFYKEKLESPSTLHYLATDPKTKLAATKLASIYNWSDKYSVVPVKKPGAKGAKSWVLHIAERPKGGANGSSGAFENAFLAKHGGADPLASNTPLSLKLRNQHLLPAGVTAHELVAPDSHINGHSPQKDAIEGLKAMGQHDSAKFLEAHYAGLNAEPIHPLADSQTIFQGGTKNHANPYLRPHEIMNSVLEHGKQLPSGVTPSMLHASTPQEQQSALTEVQQNASGHYEDRSQPAKWLQEYYGHRAEAAKPKENTFVARPANVPSSTSHPNFHVPAANPFGRGAPHNMYVMPESYAKEPIEVEGGSKTGNTSAHASSLTPQRTAPIIGSDGATYSPTHLDLPPGVHTLNDIGKAARAKAGAVIDSLFDAHQQALEQNDPEALADPHGGVPVHGVHAMSQHGFKLTQTFYKPMLEAARSSMPSEEVLRNIAKTSKIAPRDVSKNIANAIAQKLGIPLTAMREVENDVASWGGDAQHKDAYKIRVASNLLRGKAPWENTYVKIGHKDTLAAAQKAARSCSPDYLKAMLLQKAVTQAGMERYADKDGEVQFARHIGGDAATTMMGKSAGLALQEGQKGKKYRAAEMTLAGYSLKPVGTFGGTVLHRVARPEDVWQSSVVSPTHGHNMHPGEMEQFIASDKGGPTFTLSDNAPVKGNWVTSSHTDNSPAAEHWFKMRKALAPAADVVKPVGQDMYLPVPQTKEGWYTWVPPNWKPSAEHVAAWDAAMTGPDGIGEMDWSRDSGDRNRMSNPDVRRAAAQGELAA